MFIRMQRTFAHQGLFYKNRKLADGFQIYKNRKLASLEEDSFQINKNRKLASLEDSFQIL